MVQAGASLLTLGSGGSKEQCLSSGCGKVNRQLVLSGLNSRWFSAEVCKDCVRASSWTFRVGHGEVTGCCVGSLSRYCLVPSSLGQAAVLWSLSSRHPLPGGGRALCSCRSTSKTGISFLEALLMSCGSTLLIVNCLSLLCGTQGRSRILKPFSLQARNRTQRGFCVLEGPTESSVASVSLFLWNS